MFDTNKVLAGNKIGGVKNGNKLIEKSEKLLKIGKLSKNLKLSKSEKSKNENLSKSRKPLKSRNLFKFATKKVKPGCLTLDARTIFNRLQLTFIAYS